MKEGDAALADADPRRGVDQLDPGGGEARQLGVDVVDRVGDVVEALAVAGEEFADRGVGAERRAAARRGPRRRRAGPPRRPATRPSPGGRAPSRSRPRRGRSRRRDPRLRRPMWSIRPNMRRSLCSRESGAGSARRISAIAARLTSSCSGLGSLVAQRRWISRPGVWKASASGSPWWRSHQAKASTASEAPARPTTGAGRVARLARPGARAAIVPTADISIIGTIRLEPQRSCSLGTAATSSTPCS